MWVTNTLKNFQNAVGGYIETVTLTEDLAIICNEEGRLMGLPYNCTICGVSFVGDIILAGVSGEKFADLPMDYKRMKQLFGWLWTENTKEEEK